MSQLSRALVGAGSCLGIGLALSCLPSDEILLVARSVACIGVTVCAAWGRHQILAWSAQRPVIPEPSQIYAVSQAYGPAIAGEYAMAQARERTTAPDDTQRRWHNAIIRFAVLGSMRKSFGWHAMKPHVDRPGWDRLTHSLADCGVLRIGQGRTPTAFAEGWYCRRVWVSLQNGAITPPCPAESDLPVVRW